MATIRIRRGTEASRTSLTPSQGEPLYTTDEKKLYIGDGATAGGVQIGGIPARIQDGDNDTYIDTANNLLELGGPWVEQKNTITAATTVLNKPGFFSVTLNAAWSPVLTGAALPAGKVQTIMVRTEQDGTGGHAITWPGNVSWPGGSTPVSTTTPGAVDYFTFVSIDDGANWEGFASGLDL